MLKNLMEDKKIDLDAPLLSVRRFSAGAVAAPSPTPSASNGEEGDQRPPPPRRSSLPFYKSDLKSGPVRVPGVVPFVWEQTPGQPKDGPVRSSNVKPLVMPKPPPGNSVRTRKAVTFASGYVTARSSESPKDDPKIVEEENVEKKEEVVKKPEHQSVLTVDNREEELEEDDDDNDAFSDALDTLSRTESMFMNCSVSGLSGVPEAAKLSGRLPKDPPVRDFMMERFLPAAQAMACESPQYTFRKATAPPREAIKPAERVVISTNRRPAPILYQNKPDYIPHYAKELEQVDSYADDEEYYEDAGNLSSKACGLLPKFCLKSSFCLLNPVPVMKPSWGTVFRHKLEQEHQPQVAELSRFRSESDSLTPDGSSPYRHSVTSPYQSEGPPTSLHEEKGFLGVVSGESKSSKTDGSDVGEKVFKNHREINHSSRMGSGSMSPALEKTLYVDVENRPGSSDSKSSSFNTVKDTRSMTSSGEVGTESKRMEETFVAKVHERDALHPEVCKVAEPVLPFTLKKLNHGYINGDTDLKHGYNDSDPPNMKSNQNPLQSLLPPPLPKSPSESWLSRTLPSVASKVPAPQSLLGIQLHPRKQTLHVSSIDVIQETSIKPLKPQRRQIRFAEVFLSE
ncbi:hypothetical protein B296_00023708 [Ensete ventricosum]|uniref:Uncharacterized protein n=1 Tax=Ensete ventricosum TaxID=4639 RepID=A0A426Z8J0_ENSVE|nr:hypothetical protein B296_00023708 [Ensete ventricosum]